MELDFTHFVDRGDGTCTVMKLTECETCGAWIEAPNTLTAHEKPSNLANFGLIPLKVYPPSGYYDAETDMEVCDLCITHTLSDRQRTDRDTI